MELQLRAMRIGGSIGIIIPNEFARKQRILEDDFLKVKIEKTSDLSFLWGKFKDVKKPTSRIMKEIDEGEDG